MYITIGLFLMPIIFFATLFAIHLNTDISDPLDMFFAIVGSVIAAILGITGWGLGAFLLTVWLIARYSGKGLMAVLNKVEDIFVKSP